MGVQMAQKRTVGDPFDPSNQNGPQIDDTQMEKILEMIESGKSEGARLMTGGERIGCKGYFIQPTVFADVTEQMRIGREEIFGPVQSIFKFSTVDDAIEAGTVWVNCVNTVQRYAPFGGYKMSGVGREFGQVGLEELTEVKTVYIKTSTKI